MSVPLAHETARETALRGRTVQARPLSPPREATRLQHDNLNPLGQNASRTTCGFQIRMRRIGR